MLVVGCWLLSTLLKNNSDCTSVYDANFCPPSIFTTVHFVKHLSPYHWMHLRVNLTCVKFFLPTKRKECL